MLATQVLCFWFFPRLCVNQPPVFTCAMQGCCPLRCRRPTDGVLLAPSVITNLLSIGLLLSPQDTAPGQPLTVVGDTRSRTKGLPPWGHAYQGPPVPLRTCERRWILLSHPPRWTTTDGSRNERHGAKKAGGALCGPSLSTWVPLSHTAAPRTHARLVLTLEKVPMSSPLLLMSRPPEHGYSRSSSQHPTPT